MMACIVKNHHLKVLFKEIQFVAFFIFHMGKTRMQVKNDLRCLRQITLTIKKQKFDSDWVKQLAKAHRDDKLIANKIQPDSKSTNKKSWQA